MPKKVLFTIVDKNMQEMRGSVLLDAIFEAFWDDEKKQIYRRGFIPFILYFFVANFYYL